MIKRIMLFLVVLFLLMVGPLFFAAGEVTLPKPVSTEVLMDSPNLTVMQSLCEDGKILTVIVYRGREAVRVSEELGGTAFYMPEKSLLIIFDVSVEI